MNSNSQQSLIMALMTSNFFQSKYKAPKKNAKLPVGYRMSDCTRCTEGYKLEGVFYPIEFEGLTKPLHGCDEYGLQLVESGHATTAETKSPKQIQLEEILLKVVFSRIGQEDAYLRVEQVSAEIFNEERRGRIRLSPDRSLIEEKDCIEIESLSKYDKAHWIWRAFKECSGSDKIRLTREELKDFLSISRSTFAVFRVNVSDRVKKQYFLMYLSI